MGWGGICYGLLAPGVLDVPDALHSVFAPHCGGSHAPPPVHISTFVYELKFLLLTNKYKFSTEEQVCVFSTMGIYSQY